LQPRWLLPQWLLLQSLWRLRLWQLKLLGWEVQGRHWMQLGNWPLPLQQLRLCLLLLSWLRLLLSLWLNPVSLLPRPLQVQLLLQVPWLLGWMLMQLLLLLLLGWLQL
jgi:hypothetical protein